MKKSRSKPGKKKSAKAKKSAVRATKGGSRASDHPYRANVDQLRDVVHQTLRDAGHHGLTLQSMIFAPGGGCPEGQHLANVCTTDASGRQVCEWKCVSN